MKDDVCKTVQQKLWHWADWALSNRGNLGWPSVAAFWVPRTGGGAPGTVLPVDLLAEQVESIITGGRDRHGKARNNGFCMRVHRTDLYLILLAEYLGMTPEIAPEAWKAYWRNKTKLAWLLDTLRAERGIKMSTPRLRRHAETLRQFRKRQGAALGLGLTTYETKLSEAHTAVGILLDLSDRGVPVALERVG